MTARTVTFVWRDRRGRLIALGNENESWSPVATAEAVLHIRSRTHSYEVTAGGERAQVLAYRREGRWYLRTAPDDQSADNLDRLPLQPTGPAGAGVAGSFDIVITIGETALRELIDGMHASEIVQHQETLVSQGHFVKIVMSAPRLRPLPAPERDATSIGILTRVCCWASRTDSVSDPGFSAIAELSSRATVTVETVPGGTVRVGMAYTPLGSNAVQILKPLTAEQEQILRLALNRWLVDGRPGAQAMQLPPDLEAMSHVQLRFVDPGILQIGLSGQPLAPTATYPTPELSDWSVSLSRWQVAQAIYTSLADRFGGAPPPFGSDSLLIDANEDIYLTQLLVGLSDGVLLLTGTLRREATPVITAEFTARLGLSLESTGAVRAGDVDLDIDLVEWYAAAFDFFSGGSLTQAIKDGVVRALVGEGNGGPSSFFTTSLLTAIAQAGLNREIVVESQADRLEVRSSGLVVSGTLTVTRSAEVQVVLRALREQGSAQVILDATDSWAPGSTLVTARWSFGDGQTLNTGGPDLRLAVNHEYASGSHQAAVELVNQQGEAASGTVAVDVS